MLQFKSKKQSRLAIAVVLSGMVFSGFVSTASAAEPGDPPRWYKPDTTQQERAATSRKEAYAAYKEAVDECARRDKGERSSCVADAKATLQHDLGYAERRRGPQTVSFNLDNDETPASLVRRHLAMMLDEGACATR